MFVTHRPVLFNFKLKMASFIVVPSPSEAEAMKNTVYTSPQDALGPYVTIGSFVYRCSPHQDVEPGHLAMNAVQRRAARVFTGDAVQVSEFLVPMRNFHVDAVTICAEWTSSKAGPPDLTNLANFIRSVLSYQIISYNQPFVLNYGDFPVLATVKSRVRGFVDEQTEVGLEWSSGFA